MSFVRLSFVAVLFFGGVSGCVPTVKNPQGRVTTTTTTEPPQTPDNGGLDGNSTTEPMETSTEEMETTTVKTDGNTDTTSAQFEMNVFPPVSWTFPSKSKFLTESQQKDEFQARYEIQKTISEAINEVLRSSAIPSDSVTVSVDDSVSIIADVVGNNDRLQHSCIGKSRTWSVILDSEEKTITKKCFGGVESSYSPDKITGSFSTDLPESSVVWKMLERRLGSILRRMNVVVSDQISIVQNN